MNEIQLLKPCPFCGGEAIIERKGSACQSMIISCTNCGCLMESGDVVGLTALEQYAWNERAATTKSQTPEQSALVGGNFLAHIQSELKPVFDKLHKLRDQCEAERQGRIAFEITQGIRVLDEAVTLMKVYQSGDPLPTVEEVQAIYKQANPPA